MRKVAFCLSMMIMTLSSIAGAGTGHFSFKGKVRGISVTSGGFANMTTATIEVTLDLGITRKDNYSICQDVSEREYSALLALLIDSRSRNQDSNFTAKPIPGSPDFFCITSISSP